MSTKKAKAATAAATETTTTATTEAAAETHGTAAPVEAQEPALEPTPEPVSAGTTTFLPVITPTVGRRVHFWPNEEHQATFGVFDAQQPCDAGIVYVWSDREVNVEVTGPSGVRSTVQNVRLLQGEEQPEEGQSYAAWMDYQVAQARKHAAA